MIDNNIDVVFMLLLVRC